MFYEDKGGLLKKELKGKGIDRENEFGGGIGGIYVGSEKLKVEFRVK